MAKQETCYRRWKAFNKQKLRWILSMCFLLECWICAECFSGCSFSAEDWCGFSNVHDGINGPRWIRQKAPAQQNLAPYHGSRMTLQGSHPMQWPPKGDHYLYTGPTQNNRLTEKNSELISTLVEVNGTSSCLYFSYHNRVPVKLVPTLVLLKRGPNISEEFQETDEILATFYSLNSDKWLEAAVRLPVGEYHLVFSGKNYNNRTITGGQMGITNIAIAEGTCGRSVPQWLDSPGDCGFEGDVRLCGFRYSNDSTVRLMGILADSLSPSEQALRAQRRPPGDRFLAMTAQFYEVSNQGSKARLLSPEISIQTEGCLMLWYYNSVASKHDSTNALNIIRLDQTNTDHLLFRLPIPRSNRDRWYQFFGALPRGAYQLVLEAIYTGDFAENDYVGFDSVEVFNKSCSDVKSDPDACDVRSPTGEPVCWNGGTCISSGKKNFRCECGEGYYGTRCEHRYACSDRNNPCQRGGTCVPDGKIDFRCVCPSGYEGRLCEDVKKCGSPEDVLENAMLISEANTTYGSKALFECMAGWLTIGDLTATCNADGTWVTGGGKCAWVDCPQPPVFPGTVLVYVTNTSYEGIAKYRCPEGMMTTENRDYLVCRANHYNRGYYNHGYYNNRNPSYPDTIAGQWLNLDSSQHVGCYNIPRCPRPPQISYANTNYTTLLMGDVANYQCIEGYEFYGNWSSFQLNCSQNGRWNYNNQGTGGWMDFENMRYNSYLMQQFQCLRTADCGPPPKVLNSVVSYNGTKLNSQATYTCRDGYRLLDSESAVCWKIAERSTNRWVEWLFVPACEFVCPVREGRRGNLSLAVFRVHDCVLEGSESMSAKLDCARSVTYSVKRKNFNRELDKNDDKAIFYGGDLCVAERQTRVRKFGEVTVQRATKCRSFCLQSASEIRDVVVFDELSSILSQNQNREPGTIGAAYETKRKRFITRYEVISFN